MGLSYAQRIEEMDHFKKELLSALRVDDQHFLNKGSTNTSPPLPYGVMWSSTRQHRSSCVASDGVIFVCNIKVGSSSPALLWLITKNRRRRELPYGHSRKQCRFLQKMELHLVNRYRLRKPKSCLKTLGGLMIYHLSQAVKNGQLRAK